MGFHNFITNYIVSSNVKTVIIIGHLLTPTVPLSIYHQIVQETCQSFQMVTFDRGEVDAQDL